MANEITNSDDVIDSRDVIERIEELQDERQALVDALEKAKELSEMAGRDEKVEEAEEALEEYDDTTDEGIELRNLLELQNQAENYAEDWKYGAMLIRKSYIGYIIARSLLKTLATCLTISLATL